MRKGGSKYTTAVVFYSKLKTRRSLIF